MSTKLCAAYELDNSNLLCPAQNLHLVIAKRSKSTPQKPTFYLLQRVSPKEHKYISSLFEAPKWSENGSQAYSFDYQGGKYLLDLNRGAGEAKIVPFAAPSVSVPQQHQKEGKPEA